LTKLPVVIGIGCGDHLGKGRQFNLLARVVSYSPTAEVENIAGNGWRRFWLAGETPNEPERFAREITSDQAEISEEDKDAFSIDQRGRRGAMIEGVLEFARLAARTDQRH
jgi:hypothetical protein